MHARRKKKRARRPFSILSGRANDNGLISSRRFDAESPVITDAQLLAETTDSVMPEIAQYCVHTFNCGYRCNYTNNIQSKNSTCKHNARSFLFLHRFLYLFIRRSSTTFYNYSMYFRIAPCTHFKGLSLWH